MIDEIKVTNLALIRAADVQPAIGLTVLTGETGAGKTALLESCKLLMGVRADKSMVREGEEQASVQGRFYFDESAADGVRDSEGGEHTNGCATENERECVVVRSLTKDGRSRVQINGQLANVTELADTIAPHIDLCSQHDSTALLKVQNHTALLDKYAEDSAQLAAYSEALAAAQLAAEELERVKQAATLSGAQLEQARFVLSQIESVNPQVGEYEELVEQLKRAENSEALARAANSAYENLASDGNALDGLNNAIAALEEGARYDESLAAKAQALREAGYVLEDVVRDVLTYLDGVEFDAGTLAQMQERVAAYQGLIRKYGPTIEDVLAAAEEAKRTVSAVDNAGFAEREAQDAFDAAEKQLASAAKALSAVRKQAAPAFAKEATAIMSQLEMGSASLLCKVADAPRESWTKAGPNSIELMFAPAANMQPRPLAKIASGGELSRVMLALHVVMGERDDTETLVFDEIDTGVGGATALALAEVMHQLAQTHQVLVVTHLAQIAARASKHYIVHKHESEGVAETLIEEAEGSARTSEIARMLSGSVTEASLAHAEELLRA